MPEAPPEPPPEEPEEPAVDPSVATILEQGIRPGERPNPPPRPAPPPEPVEVAEAPSGQDEIADLLGGEAAERPAEQASEAPRPRGQTGRATRLSAGDEGAIRDRVRDCWNVDASARDQPVVQVRVWVDQSGFVEQAEIVDNGGSAAWAQRALRAVRNPNCQPWPRPSSGWPTDDTFLLVFDPSEMF